MFSDCLSAHTNLQRARSLCTGQPGTTTSMVPVVGSVPGNMGEKILPARVGLQPTPEPRLDVRVRDRPRRSLEARNMNDRAPSPAAFALLECAFHVLWVMYCSCFGLMGSLLATRLGGVDEDLLTLAIFVASVLVVAPVAQKMGGLSMNPANETALFAAGKIGIKEAAVRVPATMVGGTLGAGMLLSILPQEYVNFVPTPSLKPGVTLAVGFAVELLLSFVNNLILLLCMGRPGRFFQLFPLGITLASLVLFQAYTGPMMNPALGFSWGYHLNNVHEVETQLVYIGAPLVGAFSAGVAWKMAARPMKTGRIKDKRGRED